MIQFNCPFQEYLLRIGMHDPADVRVLEVRTKEGNAVSEMEYFSVRDLVLNSYALFLDMNRIYYEEVHKKNEHNKQLTLFKEDNGNIDL
tara:strand:- start:97 stop:363 length:267 start_codon:yes stop_codon:yes gene_type:complete